MSKPLFLHNRCRLRRAIAETVGIKLEDSTLRLLNNLNVYTPSTGFERQRTINFARSFLSTGSPYVLVSDHLTSLLVPEHEKSQLLSVLRYYLQLEDNYEDRQRVSKARSAIKKRKKTSQVVFSPDLSAAVDPEYRHTKSASPYHELEHNA
jgi:hypothetical protein